MTESERPHARNLFKGTPIFIWMIILVIIPLSSTLVMSFQSSEGLVIEKELTLQNYALFLTDSIYPKILLKTILMALGITLLSLAMAYPLAYMISFKMKRAKDFLFMVSIIPLWVSYLVRIIAWRTILGNNGVINSVLMWLHIIREPIELFLYNPFAIAITLTAICIPFVFIPVYTALEKIPKNIIDASNDLGANELRTFINVVFPISLPGVITGSIFAFIISLGDYIIPQQLGGTSGIMYGNLIWSQFGFAFNWPLGAALGFLLFGIAVLILTLSSKYGSGGGGVLAE
jgi:spermidine/putrescine transport system permease protein